MRNRTNFFGQNMKTRSKLREAENCLSSKNVNLCLLYSAERINIAQGIKILQKATGGSKQTLTLLVLE